MDMLDFYIRVVKALDEIGAPCMIVGAFDCGKDSENC
jgi:hypothetical protein